MDLILEALEKSMWGASSQMVHCQEALLDAKTRILNLLSQDLGSNRGDSIRTQRAALQSIMQRGERPTASSREENSAAKFLSVKEKEI